MREYIEDNRDYFFSAGEAKKRLQEQNFKRITKDEVKKLFFQFNVSLKNLDAVYNYTQGIDYFVHYYLMNDRDTNNAFYNLSNWLISLYAGVCEQMTLDEKKVFSNLVFFEKFSFSLFANLCTYYKTSLEQMVYNSLVRLIFYEKDGIYIWYPAAKEIFIKIRKVIFSSHDLDKMTESMLKIFLDEELLYPDYLNYPLVKKDKEILEKKILQKIEQEDMYLWEHYSLFQKLNIECIVNKNLRSLLVFIQKRENSSKEELSNLPPPYKYVPLGYLGQYTLTAKKALEVDYYKVMCTWYQGEENLKVSQLFCLRYGFQHLPDSLLLNSFSIWEVNFKKASIDYFQFNKEITICYLMFLNEKMTMGKKFFLRIIRKHRLRLLQEETTLYRFLLGCYHFMLKDFKKSRMYLEDVMQTVEGKSEYVFLQRIYEWYFRLLMAIEDVEGVAQLLERVRYKLPTKVPFQILLSEIEVGLHALRKNVRGQLPLVESLFNYYRECGCDEKALFYHLYILKLKGETLLYEKSLKAFDQPLLLKSQIEDQPKILITASFFGDYKVKVGAIDISHIFDNRKKIRRLFSYLLYKWPKRIGKEEIKSIFWEKERIVDVDVNFRVTLSNMKKILKEWGLEDLIKNEKGFLSLGDQYKVKCDLVNFYKRYERGKKLYLAGDYPETIRVFTYLYTYRKKRLFTDVISLWEEQERQEIENTLTSVMKILFQLMKKKKNYTKAIAYCRDLIYKDKRYEKELVQLLDIVGDRKNEIKKLELDRTNKKGDLQAVLEKIILPFGLD